MISYRICFSVFDLTSLSKIPSRSIHVVVNGKFHSFLWLSNVPLCVCVYEGDIYVCIYINTHTHTHTHTPLSIYLLMDVLGCFCILAINSHMLL